MSLAQNNNNHIKHIGPDIRNKLTPVKNLIAMLEDLKIISKYDGKGRHLVLDEIEQAKISLQYLT